MSKDANAIFTAAFMVIVDNFRAHYRLLFFVVTKH